ncbi:hypothetical protein RJT34_30238 [Clitoria ternatea]|uniref:Homeobox-leucine zipper protein n=1 Tax=Clitoria ternatea TaxID=43366 RepID=A0AAN9ESX9_CLITE
MYITFQYHLRVQERLAVAYDGDDGKMNKFGRVGEKKRRLNMEQVKAFEKSFKLGNKLELERKMQLARALGLQPRQIDIWFQNRRAKWKTKQLEKDYDVLKRQYEAIKSDNYSLQAQNQKLQAEVIGLFKILSRGKHYIHSAAQITFMIYKSWNNVPTGLRLAVANAEEGDDGEDTGTVTVEDAKEGAKGEKITKRFSMDKECATMV